MTANPVHHRQTKHIEIDIHFVHEKVALGQVRVLHVPSSHQFADIMTKGLPVQLFAEFVLCIVFLVTQAYTTYIMKNHPFLLEICPGGNHGDDHISSYS